MMKRRALCAIFFALCVAPAAALVAPSLVPSALVRTIAGDGASGVRDGEAARAEFMFPAALVYDARGGVLYIADPAAQRIRSLDRNGDVRTVAGSGPALKAIDGVAGGYVDGDAATARFNHPSGIALGKDGSLYVADAFNHCVRRIVNGRVGTFVGNAREGGRRDGALSQATFTEPRSLAVTADGTLYVLDYRVGVRVVTPMGVTTLPLPPGWVVASTGIAVWEDARGSTLFLLEENGVARYDLKRGIPLAGFSGSPQEGVGPLPSGILAIDRDEALVSSSYWDTVSFVQFPKHAGDASFSRRIAGDGSHDVTQAGGFRDGSPAVSRFFAPLGLALDAQRNILLADGGNRRIRLIPALHLRGFEGDEVPQKNVDAYHVLLVGDAFAFSNAMWDDSIAGILENRLNADRVRPGLGKAVLVEAIGSEAFSVNEQAALIRERIRRSPADAVVWFLDTASCDPKESASLAALFRGVNVDVTAAHGHLSLADHPLGNQLTAADSAAFTIYAPSADVYEGYAKNVRLEHFLSGLGIAYLPTLERFAAWDRAQHVSLFTSDNVGFSSAGRAFYADLLLKHFESDPFWRGTR